MHCPIFNSAKLCGCYNFIKNILFGMLLALHSKPIKSLGQSKKFHWFTFNKVFNLKHFAKNNLDRKLAVFNFDT